MSALLAQPHHPITKESIFGFSPAATPCTWQWERWQRRQWCCYGGRSICFQPAEPSSSNVGVDEPPNHSNFKLERLWFVMMMGQFGRSGNDDEFNCQDCRNQAKKYCVYMRCRNCCKSREYPCPTPKLGLATLTTPSPTHSNPAHN